jgi:hypothetical protein
MTQRAMKYDVPGPIDNDFAVWAFGDVWTDFLMYEAESIDLLHSWNKLHGKQLRISPGEEVRESIKKMKELWKTTLQN